MNSHWQMEPRCDEWQTGQHVPGDLNTSIMLGQYIHHMARLEAMEFKAPRLLAQLRGERFQHGYADAQTTPIIERAPDGSLKAFAGLCREDPPIPTRHTYARRPALVPRRRHVVCSLQPVASSSRPRPPVVNNRPPPEPMDFDEEEEGAPPARSPTPVDPFADERHSDGRYTSRAKGKGRG